MLNPDFKEMLQCLLDHKVEFLLVGGYALAAHGFPRATKDIDIWVQPNLENGEKVFRALESFGAPLADILPEDFAESGTIFQIGVAPNRIDIINKVDGVEFEVCRQQANYIDIEGIRIPVISREDLILNKRSSGRPQDLVDADLLENSGKTTDKH